MIARTCDACHKTITKPAVYFNLSIEKKQAHLEDSQDPINAIEGDYCRECVGNGKAVKDVMSEIDTVKLVDET